MSQVPPNISELLSLHIAEQQQRTAGSNSTSTPMEVDEGTDISNGADQKSTPSTSAGNSMEDEKLDLGNQNPSSFARILQSTLPIANTLLDKQVNLIIILLDILQERSKNFSAIAKKLEEKEVVTPLQMMEVIFGPKGMALFKEAILPQMMEIISNPNGIALINKMFHKEADFDLSTPLNFVMCGSEISEKDKRLTVRDCLANKPSLLLQRDMDGYNAILHAASTGEFKLITLIFGQIGLRTITEKDAVLIFVYAYAWACMGNSQAEDLLLRKDFLKILPNSFVNKLISILIEAHKVLPVLKLKQLFITLIIAKNLVNSMLPHESREYPTHWAATTEPCLRMLLEAKADVDKRDGYERLPIHWACYGGSPTVPLLRVHTKEKDPKDKAEQGLFEYMAWGMAERIIRGDISKEEDIANLIKNGCLDSNDKLKLEKHLERIIQNRRFSFLYKQIAERILAVGDKNKVIEDLVKNGLLKPEDVVACKVEIEKCLPDDFNANVTPTSSNTGPAKMVF